MSDDLEKMLTDLKEKRAADAVRYNNLDKDECMLCNSYGSDKRSLLIDCLYAVNEVVPEFIDTHDVETLPRRSYYLRICKSCRGRLLRHLQMWRQECVDRRTIEKDSDGDDLHIDPEFNIPVRINGAIKMLNREQWEELQNEKARGL